METFFSEYLKILETMHDEFTRALDGLTEEGLNWTPGEGMNSLAVLAVHSAGAERFWIGDVALSEPRSRDRSSEFQTQLMSGEAARARLDAALQYARSAAERLTVADLAAVRTHPRNGREITVSWALLHALEHTAMHAGHAQLTRQLWDAHAAGR